MKITIETDEKKVYGDLVEASKSGGQNAGPAPESLTESVSAGVTEIGSPHMDRDVIDGGAPPQYLLEALQATASSQSNLHENVTNNTPDNAGPAPTRNRK